MAQNNESLLPMPTIQLTRGCSWTMQHTTDTHTHIDTTICMRTLTHNDDVDDVVGLMLCSNKTPGLLWLAGQSDVVVCWWTQQTLMWRMLRQLCLVVVAMEWRHVRMCCTDMIRTWMATLIMKYWLVRGMRALVRVQRFLRAHSMWLRLLSQQSVWFRRLE